MSGWGWLARGGRFRWHKPPAPGVRDSRPPQSSPPAPGQSLPWMTAGYYPEGYVIVRDHIRRRQFKLTFPSGGDMAAEIGELLGGGCPGCGRPDGVWCEPGCLDGGKDTGT